MGLSVFMKRFFVPRDTRVAEIEFSQIWHRFEMFDVARDARFVEIEFSQILHRIKMFDVARDARPFEIEYSQIWHGIEMFDVARDARVAEIESDQVRERLEDGNVELETLHLGVFDKVPPIGLVHHRHLGDVAITIMLDAPPRHQLVVTFSASTSSLEEGALVLVYKYNRLLFEISLILTRIYGS